MIDQVREFYNSLMEKWLDDNDILMYSTHNEGISVLAKRFIRPLKGEIVKIKGQNRNRRIDGYWK